MKHKLILWLSIVMVGGSVATYVFAQQLALGSGPGRLGSAVALLNGGQPQSARDVIAGIKAGDPEFAAAQCYDALCLYQMSNRLAFCEAMKSSAVKQAVIAPELRRDLDFKHIDVLFYFRKFDEALPRIEAFQREHAGASQQSAVAEYRLATLFGRGMKLTDHACVQSDTNMFNQRWAEARANLEAFLADAVKLKGGAYKSVPKRVLKEDVWVARLTLGDEKAVLADIPAKDAEALEKASWLRVQLHQRLQPGNGVRHLQLIEEYLTAFPASKQRKRAEFDMAALNFHEGKELCLEAEKLEAAGSATLAATKRATAAGYFKKQRALQHGGGIGTAGGTPGSKVLSRAGTNDGVTIEAQDILDQRGDLLYGYALEKDFVTLTNLTSAIITNAVPGDVNWVMARAHDAIVLANQNPPRPVEASAIFDELLAMGFTGKADRDRQLITAARWRVHLAIKGGDTANVQRVMLLMQTNGCVANLKADFLKDYAAYAVNPTN